MATFIGSGREAHGQTAKLFKVDIRAYLVPVFYGIHVVPISNYMNNSHYKSKIMTMHDQLCAIQSISHDSGNLSSNAQRQSALQQPANHLRTSLSPSLFRLMDSSSAASSASSAPMPDTAHSISTPSISSHLNRPCWPQIIICASSSV